ncbi:ABC transporter substrate-binding protein [Rhizobium sp. FY34]|uniref:ABC transporter substrate-binding protein n=1 Tax=Rhizobium sp. FY34 TaxID=2562309 RepID=UPI001484EA25|nr:ABC transporter substrate-binding protein [Rhizobium sp. FY34]
MASGEPIKVGAIVGQTGLDDLSSASKAAKAYFDCVNANGGINGRPVEYLVEDDQWNPEVAAQVATKLVKDEKVVALVGCLLRRDGRQRQTLRRRRCDGDGLRLCGGGMLRIAQHRVYQ